MAHIAWLYGPYNLTKETGQKHVAGRCQFLQPEKSLLPIPQRLRVSFLGSFTHLRLATIFRALPSSWRRV